MPRSVMNFWAWLERRNFISVRSGTLYITVWLTWESFKWAAGFANSTDKAGVEVAAIIAAVTAPISMLQGYVFNVYSKSRSEN